MLKQRLQATVNVYLILLRKNELLLSLRKNTGYQDGFYSFVAGHMEENETPAEAIKREAKEEAGIDLDENHLKLVHVMHRRTDRENIDLFFLCNSWTGNIENLEPQKCEEISFHSVSKLPDNLIPYIKNAIERSVAGILYSEGSDE